MGGAGFGLACRAGPSPEVERSASSSNYRVTTALGYRSDVDWSLSSGPHRYAGMCTGWWVARTTFWQSGREVKEGEEPALLFRLARNQVIDLLRRRNLRERNAREVAGRALVMPADPERMAMGNERIRQAEVVLQELYPRTGRTGAYEFAGSCAQCTGKNSFRQGIVARFRPRLGLAYRLTNKMSIRAAYGIMYANLFNYYDGTGTPLNKATSTAWGGTYNLAARMWCGRGRACFSGTTDSPPTGMCRQ